MGLRLKRTLLSWGALILALGSTGANAAIITLGNSASWVVNNSSSVESTNSTSRTINRSADVFLDGFDGSLGTLLGVSLTFSSNWTLRNTFQVRDPSTGIFSEDNVSGNGGSSQTLRINLITPAGQAPGQASTLNNGCSDDDGFCSRNASRSAAFSGSIGIFAPLASFIDSGVDSVRVRLSNSLRSFISPCRDDEDICRSNGTNFWNGNTTIRYTYDNTPPPPPPAAVAEPGMLALLGFGLLLGGLGARRRITG